MVGMDDRVETRGMTVTKENQVVGEPREREREKKRGLDRIRGGIFQPYICVCVFIYIYILYVLVEGREERDRGITVVHACTQGCRGLVEYMHIQDLLCRWRRYGYTEWRESVLRGGPRRRYWGIVGDGLPDIRPVTPSSVHHHYHHRHHHHHHHHSLSLSLSLFITDT